jgi:hypothetical protein
MFDAIELLLEMIGDLVHALVAAPFASLRRSPAE